MGDAIRYRIGELIGEIVFGAGMLAFLVICLWIIVVIEARTNDRK